MKAIIIAAAMLCGTAQAAIHGIPSNNSTCAMVGAISGAASTHQREGMSREKTVKAIESAIKEGAPKNGVPPWARKIIEASWNATAQVPDVTAEWAEERMKARCLEK